MTKNHLRGSIVAWENIFHRASGREHQSNRGSRREEQHLCVDFELGHAYDHHKFGSRVSLRTYFRVIFLNIGYSRRPCERHSLRCFCFWLECQSKNLTFETLHVICFTFRVREKGIFEPRNLVLPSFAKSTLCTRSRRKCFDSFDLRNSKYPILKFRRSLLICLESILWGKTRFSFQINFLRPLRHSIKVTFECKVLWNW